MNLKECLRICNLDKVKEYWEKELDTYEYDSVPSYVLDDFIPYLNKIEPEINNEYFLKVIFIKEKNMETGFVSVSGYKKNSDERYCLGLDSSALWLGRDIINETKLTNEEVLACVLWEMSFYGYTDEEKNKTKEILNKRLK